MPKPKVECANWQDLNLLEQEWDVMITDPPYSARVHGNAVSQSKVRGVRKRELGFEYLAPQLRRATAQLASRVKRWIVIYSDLESLAWWRISLQAAGVTYIRTIPWVRWSMPQLSGDRPPTGAEAIVVAYGFQKGKKHWNGPGNLTHLSHKCLRGEGKHRAEKPLDQMIDLAYWFSDPGETILDPYCGAGTTGVAAALCNRGFYGVEVDPTWAEFASNRIELADQQPPKLSNRDDERRTRWSESFTDYSRHGKEGW